MADTVGEYRVILSLDADDYKKGMTDAENTAEDLQSKVNTIGGNIAKGMAAALAGASVAIGKITTDAVNAFADYEQLVGGMETLFKDSAGNALDYAVNAYKTAGLSMNDYMETVTSFSASLIKSLGGDTEKAVSYADMAITDMSDNANKMGSSMESIQNAYQGFAKQNYTMLDNLKLGYGGTKEEMKRLLKDAQAISGVKYDLSSYADVVAAIHVIQTEMGITGTTAKEAASTISGSVSMMKSAWSNMLVAIANEDLPFEQYLTSFVDSVGVVFDNLYPRIATALNGIAMLISQLAPQIIDKIPALVSLLLPTLINAAMGLVNAVVAALPGILGAFVSALPILINGIQQLIMGVTAALPGLMQTVVDTAVALVPMIAQALLDALPVLLSAGLSMMQGLAQSIFEAIPVIIEALPVIIDNIVSFLLGEIPQIIETGISLLTSLVAELPTIINAIVAAVPQIVDNIVSNIIASIPQIVEAGISLLIALVNDLPTIITTIIGAIPQIVSSICDTFNNNIDAIVDVGFKLLVALVENLPTIIIEVVKAVPQIIKSLVNAFNSMKGDIKEVGTNLVKGVFNGMSNAVSWLYGKLKGWVNSVLSYIKKLFGIHSPSRKTQFFGEMLTEGLGVGIEENEGAATKAVDALGDHVINRFDKMANKVSAVKDGLFDADYKIKGGVTFDKAGEVISKIGSSVDVTNNGLISDISNVFDGLKRTIVSGADKIVNAIGGTSGNSATGSKSLVINLGGMHISGLIGHEALTQVKKIANDTVDEVVVAVADRIPAFA